MAELHVLSALINKKSEIAGQILILQKQVTQLEESVQHIDGCIKLFDPSFDLRTVPAKTQYKKNNLFEHGEVQRLVLNTMRQSQKPLSNQDITTHIMKIKGVENTKENSKAIYKSVFSVLKAKKGSLIAQVETVGSEEFGKWYVI